MILLAVALLGNGVIPVSDGLLDDAGLLLQVCQLAPQVGVLLLQQGTLEDKEKIINNKIKS